MSSLSSHNGSEMEVASPSFIQTAASSSSSPNKDNSNTETRNEKSCVSDSLEEEDSNLLQINKDCVNVENDSHSDSDEESTTQAKLLLINSDSVQQYIVKGSNLKAETKAYYAVKSSFWESELRKQDAVWQNMFEENPKIDLFPICFKYFQNVKSDMRYNEVFNQWLKIQKLKYPHRLTYQRMKLEDFPRDPLKGIRM